MQHFNNKVLLRATTICLFLFSPFVFFSQNITAEDWFIEGETDFYYELYDNAITCYEKALQIKPKMSKAYIRIGEAYIFRYKYKEAVLALDSCLSILSKSDSLAIDCYFIRGKANFKLKEYQSAITDFNMVLELDSCNTSALIERGKVKNTINQNEAAILDYSLAIQLDSSLAIAYFNRGIAKLDLGRNKDACEDWCKAESLGLDTYERIPFNCQKYYITINENTKSGGWVINECPIQINKRISKKKSGYWTKKWFLLGNRVRKLSFYVDGKKNGEELVFYFNGELKIEKFYKDGKKHGDFIYTPKYLGLKSRLDYDCGKTKKYVNGKLISKTRFDCSSEFRVE